MPVSSTGHNDLHSNIIYSRPTAKKPEIGASSIEIAVRPPSRVLAVSKKITNLKKTLKSGDSP